MKKEGVEVTQKDAIKTLTDLAEHLASKVGAWVSINSNIDTGFGSESHTIKVVSENTKTTLYSDTNECLHSLLANAVEHMIETRIKVTIDDIEAEKSAIMGQQSKQWSDYYEDKFKQWHENRKKMFLEKNGVSFEPPRGWRVSGVSFEICDDVCEDELTIVVVGSKEEPLVEFYSLSPIALHPKTMQEITESCVLLCKQMKVE